MENAALTQQNVEPVKKRKKNQHFEQCKLCK